MKEKRIELKKKKGNNFLWRREKKKDYFQKYPGKQNTKKNRKIEEKATTTKTSERN